jgi:hypothetical protein
MTRAEYMWAVAQQERRGVPINLPVLERIRSHWSDIQVDLTIEKDEPYGIYEIVDGVPHWRKQRFADYVRQHGMVWPIYPDGSLDETDQTSREMAGRYPHIETLRDGARSTSTTAWNGLAVKRCSTCLKSHNATGPRGPTAVWQR